MREKVTRDHYSQPVQVNLGMVVIGLKQEYSPAKFIPAPFLHLEIPFKPSSKTQLISMRKAQSMVQSTVQAL